MALQLGFRTFFASSILVAMWSATALAKTVFVAPAAGTIDANDLKSVTELVKIGVTKVRGYSVSEDEGKADVQLKTSVLKLGDALLINVKKDEKGRATFSTDMKARSLEDLDVVTTRLVRSALTEKSAPDTATVQDITEEEQIAGTRRYQATRQWQLGFGPAWSNALNTRGGGTNWSLGYTWGLDPHYDPTMMLDFYTARGDEDGRTSNFSVGMNYLFGLGKHTPFVTADLGYASATADDGCDTGVFSCTGRDDKASGWALGVGAGYKFFRTSTVNVGLTARYYVVLDKTSEGNPGVFATRIVVYY